MILQDISSQAFGAANKTTALVSSKTLVFGAKVLRFFQQQLLPRCSLDEKLEVFFILFVFASCVVF